MPPAIYDMILSLPWETVRAIIILTFTAIPLLIVGVMILCGGLHSFSDPVEIRGGTQPMPSSIEPRAETQRRFKAGLLVSAAGVVALGVLGVCYAFWIA